MAQLRKKRKAIPGYPSIQSYPAFLRRVIRAARWQIPLEEGNPRAAARVLNEQGGDTSLWLVSNDTDLRRVTIAMNEHRDSFHETLELLPIFQVELDAVGATPRQVRGDTQCEAAKSLHHDIDLDADSVVRLCQVLIDANRQLERCTKGEMRKAEELSIAEGCFAVVPESPNCACSAG